MNLLRRYKPLNNALESAKWVSTDRSGIPRAVFLCHAPIPGPHTFVCAHLLDAFAQGFILVGNAPGLFVFGEPNSCFCRSDGPHVP